MVLLVRSAQKNFLCQERTRIWIQIRCSRHKYVLLRHSSKRRICKYEDIVVWLRNKSCHYAWRTIDGWSIWVFLALSLLSYMRFITYKFFSTSRKDPLLLATRSILISQNSVTGGHSRKSANRAEFFHWFKAAPAYCAQWQVTITFEKRKINIQQFAWICVPCCSDPVSRYKLFYVITFFDASPLAIGIAHIRCLDSRPPTKSIKRKSLCKPLEQGSCFSSESFAASSSPLWIPLLTESLSTLEVSDMRHTQVLFKLSLTPGWHGLRKVSWPMITGKRYFSTETQNYSGSFSTTTVLGNCMLRATSVALSLRQS